MLNFLLDKALDRWDGPFAPPIPPRAPKTSPRYSILEKPPELPIRQSHWQTVDTPPSTLPRLTKLSKDEISKLPTKIFKKITANTLKNLTCTQLLAITAEQAKAFKPESASVYQALVYQALVEQFKIDHTLHIRSSLLNYAITELDSDLFFKVNLANGTDYLIQVRYY